MTLHDKTFLYLTPTDKQRETMDELRRIFTNVGMSLQHCLPDGPDKTYVFRLLRTMAMWSHVAITRNEDGSPRD